MLEEIKEPLPEGAGIKKEKKHPQWNHSKFMLCGICKHPLVPENPNRGCCVAFCPHCNKYWDRRELLHAWTEGNFLHGQIIDTFWDIIVKIYKDNWALEGKKIIYRIVSICPECGDQSLPSEVSICGNCWIEKKKKINLIKEKIIQLKDLKKE